MPIKKANELDFSNKKIAMLLLARAGVGKTTLAFSAPKPLLIDLENGVDRVEACYRNDTMTCDTTLSDEEKYHSFIKDLTTEDLSNYDTIIVDSLGKFVELATPVVIKENPVNAQKDGKTLSLKGYGAVSAKVSEFIKMLKKLGKNIIFIAHVTEINDGDQVKVRVDIPGSTKNKIWDDIDLGGYITFYGKDRVIHFSPSDAWDAKGNHGITGDYTIPTLKPTTEGGRNEDNKFLTALFDIYTADLIKTRDLASKSVNVINEIVPKIKELKDDKELNAMLDSFKDVDADAPTKKELFAHLTNKAESVGCFYDTKTKRFSVSEQAA